MKKQTVTEKQGGKETVETIFTITKKGVEYLSTHDQNIINTVALNEALPYLTISGEDDTGKDRRQRQARRTALITLANLAGGAIPVQNYTSTKDDAEEPDEPGEAAEKLSNGDQKLPLKSYIASVLTEEAYQSLGLYEFVNPNETSFAFYDAACVKAYANLTSSDASTTADYISGRYSGIAESRTKTVMLFAPSSFGMGWYKWATMREASAYRLWIQQRQITSRENRQRSGTCAAVAVENPRDFYKLYRDVGHKRQSGNEEFGGMFDHAYVIPLTPDGAKHLRWIMTSDDERVNEQIQASAIQSGSYRIYKGAYESLFPLMNVHSDLVALGFQFDGKHLSTIETIARNNQERRFELLCAEWQLPYYERVLPDNVELTGMPMG